MIAKNYLIALSTSCLFSVAVTAQENAEPETTKTDISKTINVPKEGEEFVIHTVTMGETVMLISKKYKVKPQDIYEYNPEAAQGVGASAVLQIPMHRKFKSKKAKDTEAAATEAAVSN